ncbi:hypothetical protein D3C76_1469230 [compost metagenome]
MHLEQQHQGSESAQVQAQGQLLQKLAEQLSIALKPLANQPAVVEEQPKKAAPVQVRKEPEKSKIPLATPIRTDLEVFRF